MASTAPAAPVALDKSLDDIISSKKAGRGRGGARRRSGPRAHAQILGNGPTPPATRARVNAAQAAKASNTVAVADTSDKILVSNLPADVSEVQVKELFSSTIGPLRGVTLHHDSNGRSKGVAEVHFQRKGDATAAFARYHKCLIDGSKPMKIDILVAPTRAPATASLVSRVTPVTNAAGGNATTTRTGGRPRQGRGGRGGGRKIERPQKSAADLDAEMEDYTTNNAPAA